MKYCHTQCKANDWYNKRVIGQIIRERTGLGAIEGRIAAMNYGELEYVGQEFPWEKTC